MSSSRKQRRKIYQKGWYYEKVALQILRSKFGHFFFVKSPPNYPWDLTIVFNFRIYLVEVKFSEKDYIYIPRRKIIQMQNYVKHFKNDFDFVYIVIAFFGSKYNYVFRTYNLKELPRRQIVLQNPKLPSSHTNTN